MTWRREHILNHRLPQNGGPVDFCLRLGGWIAPILAMTLVACAPSASGLQSQDGMRDFPPLTDPNRPESPSPADPGSGDRLGEPDDLRIPDLAEIPDLPPEESAYRLGVGDEVNVLVVGQPNFTRGAKVLPDGTIATPGTDPVYVLGQTVSDASQRIEQRLSRYLRYPDVDVMVTEYGEHVVYVMGEVEVPADHPYRKGLTVLQAIAMAGGFEDSGQRKSVVVFRRVGEDEAEFYKLDLKQALDKGVYGDDMFLRPYDIVYVPKTFIANVNTFVDQWFRQNISALNFYLEGWDAYSVTQDRVTIRRN